MDNPIISPWIFYIASLFNSLSIIIYICIFVLVALVIVNFSTMLDYKNKQAYLMANSESYNDMGKNIRYEIKEIKKYAYIALALLALNMLIPSEKTVYQMMAANLATPNNIEYIKTDAIQFVKNMAQAIEEAKGGEKTNGK